VFQFFNAFDDDDDDDDYDNVLYYYCSISKCTIYHDTRYG
jgi:hypothetical protein